MSSLRSGDLQVLNDASRRASHYFVQFLDGEGPRVTISL